MRYAVLRVALPLMSALATSVAAGQESPTSSPGSPQQSPPISITAPVQMPAIVEAAARNVAHTIVQRKNANGAQGDPHEVFGTASTKIAIFAFAAAADPEKAKTVDYAAQYIATGETQRTDKQVTASAKTSGSTSTVDKAGLPYLLGLEIDHGAVTKTVSGSTFNLSSSAYALVASVKGDTAQIYRDFSGYTRIGFSAAFNVQNQNDPLASVQRKQLAEWSIKVRLLGDHSPRSKDAYDNFVKLILPALQDKANSLAKALSDILGGARARPVANFSSQTNEKINQYLNGGGYNSSDAEQKISDIILAAIHDDIYSQWANLGLTADDQVRLSAFLTAYKISTDAYVKSAMAFDSVLKDLANKPSLTFSYLQERSSGTPDYSVTKLLYEKKPRGFMQIDANASASFYNKPDKSKNQQTFRDVTIAVGLEQDLGRSPFLSNGLDKNPITLSFSGSYERFQENRHVPGKKADIAVANLKLELPVTAGVSLPISITYANATELIKEKDVRGSFGVTFDLDKLKSLMAAH
jgi:hypothetical protein